MKVHDDDGAIVSLPSVGPTEEKGGGQGNQEQTQSQQYLPNLLV